MKPIEARLAALQDAPLTIGVLKSMDHVVPGEWTNITSLQDAAQHYLGLTDGAEIASVAARASLLYQTRPHYRETVVLFDAVDVVDKAAAAAVVARQAGRTFAILDILTRFTPKEETTQALDAAMKLMVEVVAFAKLRGIPLTSLTEAKAFPATLATYAKADRMRLASWIAFDGLLALGPEFMAKITEVVKGTGAGALAGHGLFKKIGDALPGGSDEEKKGFVLAALSSAGAFVTEFVKGRGLEQGAIAGALGKVVNAADAGSDVLAAVVDASTNYYAHTGVQSVARVLVHDAKDELDLAETTHIDSPEDLGSSWFRKAAAIVVGGTAGAGLGSLLLPGKAAEVDPEEDTDMGDPDDDDELDALDDHGLAARELGLEMRERDLDRLEQRMEEHPEADEDEVADPWFDEDRPAGGADGSKPARFRRKGPVDPAARAKRKARVRKERTAVKGKRKQVQKRRRQRRRGR